MVFCKNCGQELDEALGLPLDERNPCPSCGSMSRHFTKEFGGSLTLSGRLIGQKNSPDGTEAIRVADSQKQTIAADFDFDRSISYNIKGRSYQGEAGVLDVCKILIEQLNAQGAQWGTLKLSEDRKGKIDCVAIDQEKELNIQVTRAVQDQELRKSLAKFAEVTRHITVTQAVEDLRSAVKHKEDIPLVQRANILLALDATETPGHALSTIIKTFRQRYGQEVRKLGFQAIWLVGPLSTLTAQLDTEELL
jgi:hypothetical protein